MCGSCIDLYSNTDPWLTTWWIWGYLGSGGVPESGNWYDPQLIRVKSNHRTETPNRTPYISNQWLIYHPGDHKAESPPNIIPKLMTNQPSSITPKNQDLPLWSLVYWKHTKTDLESINEDCSCVLPPSLHVSIDMLLGYIYQKSEDQQPLSYMDWCLIYLALENQRIDWQ